MFIPITYATDYATGMVACYDMDDETDYTGNFNLTNHGADFNLNCIGSDNCVYLDGADYLDITTDMTGQFGTSATLLTLLKLDSDSAQSSFHYIASHTSTEVYPYVTDGNIYSGIFRNDRLAMGSDGAFNKASWHTVIVTSSPGAGNYDFYQNTTNLYSGTEDNVYIDGNNQFIGGGNNAPDYFMIGQVALVVIWNVSHQANINELSGLVNGGYECADLSPPSAPAGTITISSLVCTSPDPDDSTAPYTTYDTTPTFTLNTNVAANCSISEENATYDICATTNATSHVCTVPVSDTLIDFGTDYVYFNCTNGTATNTYVYEMDMINYNIVEINYSSKDYGYRLPRDICWNLYPSGQYCLSHFLTVETSTIDDNISCSSNDWIQFTHGLLTDHNCTIN